MVVMDAAFLCSNHSADRSLHVADDERHGVIVNDEALALAAKAIADALKQCQDLLHEPVPMSHCNHP